MTVAIASSLVATLTDRRRDPDSCIASETAGCIHGVVLEDRGNAVKGLEIEVIPGWVRDHPAEPGFRREWTDVKGRFNVDVLEPGAYVIAVHYTNAPFERQPYSTSFYPGVEEETRAEAIVVDQKSPSYLKPFHIRSLPVATIEVTVAWPDGTRPQRSNLMFHNRSFPRQAVIGDVAPQIDDGAGSFRAPVGFDYEVRANVQCDAGDRIESRESLSESISIGNADDTPKISLRIPGLPCNLWHPH